MKEDGHDLAASPLSINHDNHDNHDNNPIIGEVDGQSVSEVSNMTDDRSYYERVKGTGWSVLKQSLYLLRGENPELTEEVEFEAEPEYSPGGEHENEEGGGGDTAREAANYGEQDECGGAQEEDEDLIDFLQDDPKDMTYSRRIALSLMKSKKWYNPRLLVLQQEDASSTAATEDGTATIQQLHRELSCRPSRPMKVTTLENPCLARAWAYFEHVTLARFVVEPKEDQEQKKKKSLLTRVIRKVFHKGSKQLDIAEPGEAKLPTKLYSPIFTPLKQMGDFGLGVGLYFSTLRSITILTLLAGLINIPNLMYFSGDDYSDKQHGVNTMLKGSAICTREVWVPCPGCDQHDFQDRRFGTAITNNNGGGVSQSDDLLFVLKNDCEGATLTQGMVSYATLLFVLLGFLVMNRYQKRMEVKFDEDEQTAQDYSIQIDNPPGDATSPEEWHAFFKENFDGAHATVVTVAVDNDLLVRYLVHRRECIRAIECIVEPGTSLDNLNLASMGAAIERERTFFQRVVATVAPGVPELFGKIAVDTAKIQGMAQQDYPATNVFVTFETEADQRRVLTALNVGSSKVKRNDVTAIADPKHLFRGQHVLSVAEADEPSTIRWQDLNEGLWARVKQLAATMVVTLCAIVVIAILVKVLKQMDAIYSAVAIAIANSAFPEFAKILTRTEAHASESGKQTSLYVKIAVFRWVLTAIVITIITPFTSTLTDGQEHLIVAIYTLFFAELVTTNLIQISDPMGHLKRHLLAPRAATQDAMNMNMQGTEYELAERYTNMTKILFLTFWYSAIYPAAYFMCSGILFVNFFVDRFSLMRTWKPASKLGNSISRFSRKYFFSVALVALAVVSGYFWSGFPFDNTCQSDTTVPEEYVGTWTIQTDEDDKVSKHLAVVTQGSKSYRYCMQDLLRLEGVVAFPPLSGHQPEGDEWMTDDQEVVTDVFGLTCVVVIVLVLLSFVRIFWKSFVGTFRGTYKASGEDQGIHFSDVPTISSYIPQVNSKIYSYPLLCCDTKSIPEELYDWTDQDKPFSFYDLSLDAKELCEGVDIGAENQVFSQVMHFPPPPRPEDEDE